MLEDSAVKQARASSYRESDGGNRCQLLSHLPTVDITEASKLYYSQYRLQRINKMVDGKDISLQSLRECLYTASAKLDN
jgi:hypothetical protein